MEIVFSPGVGMVAGAASGVARLPQRRSCLRQFSEVPCYCRSLLS